MACIWCVPRKQRRGGRDNPGAKQSCLVLLWSHTLRSYADVPWVVEGEQPNDELFRSIVLHGVEGGPAGVRTRLRTEVLRWHPDKFEARWGARLVAAERQRILARVQETAGKLTGLMGAGK